MAVYALFPSLAYFIYEIDHVDLIIALTMFVFSFVSFVLSFLFCLESWVNCKFTLEDKRA